MSVRTHLSAICFFQSGVGRGVGMGGFVDGGGALGGGAGGWRSGGGRVAGARLGGGLRSHSASA